MEARSYAAANAARSKQLQDDVDRFLAEGGRIQQIPARAKNEMIDAMKKSAFPEYGPPSKRKAARAKKESAGIIDTGDDVDVSPSTTTPTEQLEIEVDNG